MQISPFFAQALSVAAAWKYLIVFVGTIVEGPILMIAGGFLLRLGFFDFLSLYAAFISGDLVGDIVWYFIGKHFADPIVRKHGKFFGVSPELFDKAKKLFHKYHESILFISKITIGLGLSLGVLMVAGATRVSFKKYVLLNFLGELILVGVLIFIGYSFGELYNKIESGFKDVFLATAIIVVISTVFGFTRYMKNRAANL